MSPVFEPRDGCAVVIALCGGAALDACLARLRGEVGRCIVVLRDDQAAPQSGIAAAAQAPQAQNLHLALVGDLAGDGFHANAEEVLTQVAAPDMPARRVHCTGFVDDADLIALYSDALAVALPSFSEGFGLPALEGMACGTPVLCSREGALPEVVGGGGLSFDPHDPVAIGNAILAVSRAPARRAVLAAEALKRARQFTWAGAASRTLAVLEACGQGR